MMADWQFHFSFHKARVFISSALPIIIFLCTSKPLHRKKRIKKFSDVYAFFFAEIREGMRKWTFICFFFLYLLYKRFLISVYFLCSFFFFISTDNKLIKQLWLHKTKWIIHWHRVFQFLLSHPFYQHRQFFPSPLRRRSSIYF